MKANHIISFSISIIYYFTRIQSTIKVLKSLLHGKMPFFSSTESQYLRG